MTEKFQPILVLVTAPDNMSARKIASELLERKIAACVNISPSWTSIYRWEDEVQEDVEVLMFIKSKADYLASQLIPCIQEMHPYDLPEIIAVPIQDGEPNYLAWIADSLD